jgi:hypothetical protein
MFEDLYILAGLVGAAGLVAAILFVWAPIRPTPSDRRQAPRIAAPPNCAVLSVDGAPYPLKNWSVTGFLADPYEGNLAVGQKCFVNIHVRQDPFDIAFAAEVVIVRKKERELAGRFVFLPSDNRGQIEAYFAYFAQMG